MLLSSLKSTFQTPAFEVPAAAKDYEYYLVTTSFSEPNSNSKEWKLRDDSGCEHNLPYFFTKGSLNKFEIVSGDSYFCNCILRCWPKDLQLPRTKFYSITTLEISPSEQCSEPPIARSRRKGEQEWANGVRVTFESSDEVRECQLLYKLQGGITVTSPILEVTCLWKTFNFEKSTCVDYEEMLANRKLAISVIPNIIYKTSYRSTVRLLEPNNHDNNKPTDVSSKKNVAVIEYQIMLGARYEVTVHIEKLDVSYSRIIQVPNLVPVDNLLWTSIFGDADRVTYHSRLSKIDSTNDDMDVTEFTLYKHGAFTHVSTIRPWKYSFVPTKYSVGGTFTLTKDSVHIELLQLYKNKTEPKPSVTLSPIVSSFDDQVPAPLHLPELVRLIGQYADFARFSMRQVCKAWYHLIRPTISGTVTAKFVDVYRQKLIRKG